jgi:hypothetical protein
MRATIPLRHPERDERRTVESLSMTSWRRTTSAFVVAIELAAQACGSSQPSPSSTTTSSPAPAVSTFTFDVAAGPRNPADGGSFTTANASFGADEFTTCVPNPSLGTTCPDLAVSVRGTNGRTCVFIVFAPLGAKLGVGTYISAGAGPTSSTAGFSLGCARAGTTCGGDSTGAFTISELQATSAGVITRLHMTFEQTCLGGTPLAVGPFGKGTGELWIVDGTMPFS